MRFLGSSTPKMRLRPGLRPRPRPHPLAGGEGLAVPSPRTRPPPLSALRAWSFGRSGRRAFPLFLFYETTTEATCACCSCEGGDCMSYHVGMKFSTKDQDNDLHTTASCAKERKGGWWYKGTNTRGVNRCYHANLNGVYWESGSMASLSMREKNQRIIWCNLGYSMKITELKIRPY